MKWRDRQKDPAVIRAAPRRAWPLPVCAVILAWLAVGGGLASAEPLQVATASPEQTVESLHSGLIALAADQGNAEPEHRYQALLPLIVATHDLEFIAEFTIRRHWPLLSEADRSRFTAAFERLSVMTYASRFGVVDADTFGPIEGSAANSGRAEVRSAIRRPNGLDIPLEFVLQQGDGGWRIINVVADGVSDLALKRAEYQRVISDGGIDALLAHIDEQLARLVN